LCTGDEMHWLGLFLVLACRMYTLFRCGCREKTEGLGVFVAEKWVDQVIQTDRYNEKSIVVKLVLGDRVTNVFSIYVPHSSKYNEEKKRVS